MLQLNKIIYDKLCNQSQPQFQTTTNRDGSLSFDCQHGQVECEANIYHACTIEAVQDQKVLLNVISCMIANNFHPKDAMISCAKEYHVDYEAIQKCYDSPHGAELLKLHGEATGALRPRVLLFFLHYLDVFCIHNF